MTKLRLASDVALGLYLVLSKDVEDKLRSFLIILCTEHIWNIFNLAFQKLM